jgi:hypothetical protein
MKLPIPPRWLRWLLAGWMLVIFIWLSLEERSALSVALLGTGSALVIGARQMLIRFGGRLLSTTYALPAALLWGAGVGMGSAVATVGLMFLKTVMHAHVFPDYSPMQMLAMLERAPWWAAAGALASTGVFLLGMSIHSIYSANNSSTRATNAPSPSP